MKLKNVHLEFVSFTLFLIIGYSNFFKVFAHKLSLKKNMSDMVTYAEESRIRNDKIVNGYIRINTVKYNRIPDDIISICFKYFNQMQEVFNYYNPKYYMVANDHLTVTQIHERNGLNYATIYGSIAIPSCSSSIHKWTFRVEPKGRYECIGIGIDETKCIRKNGGSLYGKHGQSKVYGVFEDGEKVEWDTDDRNWDNALKFKERITMELDLNNRTLSYMMGSDLKQVAFKDITVDEDIIYCMAVCIGYKGSVVELLSYTSSE